MNFPVKDLFQFLKGLEKNNNKLYVDAHRKEYQDLRKEFILWVDDLIQAITKFDSSIVPLNPKTCLFRLNRDVRFSSNKKPYNTHFSAYIARGGKKSEYAGYYIRLQPKNRSMIGAGLYHPPPRQLLASRQHISTNFTDFKKIINNASIKRSFPSFEGERLQNIPRGFAKSDPAAEFLKLKSWGIFEGLSDKEVLSRSFEKNILIAFKSAKPLNSFFNSSVIPRIDI